MNEGEFCLDQFCRLDDNDVMSAIKKWSHHPDIVLSELCNGLLNRQLLKCRLQAEPIPEENIEKIQKKIAAHLHISFEDAGYLAFTGEAINTTYKLADEHINILFKDGSVKEISKVDNPLIHQTLSTPVKKFYICQLS